MARDENIDLGDFLSWRKGGGKRAGPKKRAGKKTGKKTTKRASKKAGKRAGPKKKGSLVSRIANVLRGGPKKKTATRARSRQRKVSPSRRKAR